MKKLLPLIVLAAAFSFIVSAPAEASFSDVPDNYWASEYIAYAEENDLIDGMDDGNFHPDDTLTETQCCQILFNMSGNAETAEEGEAWYTQAVEYVETTTGLTVQPEAEATREFLCRLFYWYEMKNPRVTFYGLSELPFADCVDLPIESQNAIKFCVRNGIVNGFPDGTFRPEERLTRAQGAKVFSVLYDWYEEEMTPEERAAWDKADELVAYAEGFGLTVDVYSVQSDTFCRCVTVYGISDSITYRRWGQDEDEVYVAGEFYVYPDVIYSVEANSEEDGNAQVSGNEDDWGNYSELPQEFFDRFFAEYAEMRQNSDPDNILIVMSHGRPNDYGAERVVEAPNNTWFLQYATAEERDAAYAELIQDSSIIVDRNDSDIPLDDVDDNDMPLMEAPSKTPADITATGPDASMTEISVAEIQAQMEDIAGTMEFWQKSILAIVHLAGEMRECGWTKIVLNNRTGIFSDGTYWGMVVFRSDDEYREIIVGGRGEAPLRWKLFIPAQGVHSYSREEAELWVRTTPNKV